MRHLYKRGKGGGCFIFTARDLRGKDSISQTSHFPRYCYSKPVLGIQMVESELTHNSLRIIRTPEGGFCYSKPVRIITNETTLLHNPRLRWLEIADRFTLLCFVLFTLEFLPWSEQCWSKHNRQVTPRHSIRFTVVGYLL